MKKTDLTKKTIIDSTIKILRKNGNVTVKEIAADANVNIAAINYHFNDKQNLIVIVVRRLLTEFKATMDEFLNTSVSTSAEIYSEIKGFLDTFYQFAFENIGIIKYILIPNNNDILESCSRLFMSQFSIDSEFTHKIVSKLGEINTQHTSEQLKVKYVFLFSAFAFPLIFQLNLKDFDNKSLFQISEGAIRDIYIEQLTKVILD
ncbi:MAG: TetR/AcrR family transcriptional regulator [Clostridia bacterium]